MFVSPLVRATAAHPDDRGRIFVFSKNSTNAGEREKLQFTILHARAQPHERVYVAEHVCISFISAYVPQPGCHADEELVFLQHKQQTFYLHVHSEHS